MPCLFDVGADLAIAEIVRSNEPLYLGEGEIVAPVSAVKFSGALEKSVWLPNAAIAKAWAQYVKDTAVPDTTQPPAPTNVQVKGGEITWECEADLAGFIIERDGKFLANVCRAAEESIRPSPSFKTSNTATHPRSRSCRCASPTRLPDGNPHRYHVIAVNTVGLKSPPLPPQRPFAF